MTNNPTPPPTNPSPATSNPPQPQIVLTRDQVRDVLMQYMTGQQRSLEDTLAYVRSLNSKWAERELQQLIFKKVIKARVVAQKPLPDGTPVRPQVTYYA